MGSKHYNKAVDCWAVGCVMAELASLRPIFKGEEAKLDSKKNVPFQKDQLLRIFEVLGTPSESDWPSVVDMPEYPNMKRLDSFEDHLANWCQPTGLPIRIDSEQGYNLLRQLFAYDPDKRLTAKDALQHKWFHEDPLPTWNAFETANSKQIPPRRRITQDEAPSMMPAQTNQTQAQAQAQAHVQAQPQISKSASSASFTSLSGGNAAGQSGNGNRGPPRKKSRIG
jgi:cyclin-dependent kinase 8/11